MSDDNTDLQQVLLTLSSELFYSIKVDSDKKLSPEWYKGAVEPVTGFSEQDLIVKGGIAALVPPEDKRIFESHVLSVLGGKEKIFEYRIIAIDGQSRYLKDRCRPEMDGQGNLVRVTGVITDLSDLKQLERALERSEEYYKMVFDKMADAISIVDPDTEIVIDVNPSACEMYGFSKEEFIGLSFVSLTKQKVRGQTEMKKFIKTGSYPLYYTTHYRKDDSEIELEISASMIEIDGKKALMSIHRDVTGRNLID